MQRDSFIFYKSFYDSIKELAPEEQVQIYNAIFSYQFENKEPSLNGICKSIFTLILPQLEANNKRYLNGCKGGAPKGNQNATKKQPKNNQKTTKKQPNENDNENDNENVNENDNEKNNNVVVDFFNNNFRMITPFEYEKIKYWINDLSEELVLEALKECVNRNVRTMSYLEAILKNWKTLNYKSVSDIKNTKGKEPTPEWLNKKVEKKEASEEEKKEIEAMLNEFKEE
ncbi:MAG TPA: DnaD domain protein [Candidatus Scybalomonas excrementigallinarum]|nr:DnaD domain protein [Candidatus Scybalomonas excrementigallinarum]